MFDGAAFAHAAVGGQAEVLPVAVYRPCAVFQRADEEFVETGVIGGIAAGCFVEVDAVAGGKGADDEGGQYAPAAFGQPACGTGNGQLGQQVVQGDLQALAVVRGGIGAGGGHGGAFCFRVKNGSIAKGRLKTNAAGFCGAQTCGVCFQTACIYAGLSGGV